LTHEAKALLREVPDMSVVKVTRSGVRGTHRPIAPQMACHTTLTVLPMTLDRVGHEAAAEETATVVTSLAAAFVKFRPSVEFITSVQEVEIAAELEFRSLEDFEPRMIRSGALGKRNDLAALQGKLSLLHRLREQFTLLAVKRAWERESQRREIIEAVAELREALGALSEGAGGRGMTEPLRAAMFATDIIAKRTARKAIETIFNVIHPALTGAALPGDFTADTALNVLSDVSNVEGLLNVSAEYHETLANLDAETIRLESIGDQALAEFFEKLRPIERSYRLVQLFFMNGEVQDGVERPPLELHIINADTQAIPSDVDSSTIAAVDEFVQSRNDRFAFQGFVRNLVMPGYLADGVRTHLEDLANHWGVLLIGDLRDDMSVRSLFDQFRTDGGAYEFLKRREDKEAANVVVAGYVKLRDRHWFEGAEGVTDDAGLYAPASLVFAGSLARTDRTTGGAIASGPVGMFFGTVRGVERARIEPRISQMEHLSMQRLVVTIIRNEDNDLCFVSSRSQAEDPKGVLKLFTGYRIVRYLERRIAVYMRRVAERRLTRDLVKEQVRNPLEELLEDEKRKGTIYNFNLDIDFDEQKFAQGVLDVELEVLPFGPEEMYAVKIDIPVPVFRTK
jgi:hypothetical protein